MRATLVLTALLIANGAADLQAQNRNQKQQRETLQTSGTIKGIAGGLIQMVTKDGEQWVLKVDARPDSLWYYAEAEPNWLKSGMLVRFSGRFNKQGQAEGTIRSLSVVTPSPDVRPGVKVDSAQNLGKNLFSKEQPQEESAPQAVAADVVGKLTGIKNGEFTVSAPGVTVRAALDEKAIISVELKSLQMAKVGDSIEVNGWYPPGAKGRAIANRVTVRAKEPLKAWVRPAPRTKPAKGKAAPDDDPLNGPK